MVDTNGLVGADIAILVIYFLLILATGFFAVFRSRVNSVQGYFLAGRFMTWLPVGASLFASNIGSEHFIGLAGSGAANGIAVGAFEFNAAILLQLLGWVFLPVYISSGVFTLPDYMKKRFGGSRIRIYLSLLSLLLYIFTKISTNLYSGSIFINEALGWNIWYSIIFILAMTAVITIMGGLAAVLYTDLVQAIVMLLGAIILTIMAFVRIGGFEGLLDKYGQAIREINVSTIAGQELVKNIGVVTESVVSKGVTPTVDAVAAAKNISTNLTCLLPTRSAFVMLRGISDPEMPWLGFLLGQTPASIWYWCTDQMMVQRALAAKNLAHAQGATLMAGFIKLLPLFIIVIPGMISRILFPNSVGCGSPEECYEVCGNRHGCSDRAYPKMVMGIMPNGLRGLMLAVMLAALMSDLTSIFNSSSTLFTVDIYTYFRKKASNRELMIVGRLFVLVMVGLSILWVPAIQMMQGGQLFIYIQSISGFLAPPIAAVYLMALLWKRNNELGAFTGLIYGFVIGMVRMILSFIYHDPVCGEPDMRPWIVGKVHYMYFAMFSFFTTGVVMCCVSLFSDPPTPEQVQGLTFWTRNDDLLVEEQSAKGDGESGLREVRLGKEIVLSTTDDDGEVVVEVEEEVTASGDGAAVAAAKNGKASREKLSVESDNDDDMTSDDSTEIKGSSRSKCLRIASQLCQWFWGFTDSPCPSDVQCACCSRLFPSQVGADGGKAGGEASEEVATLHFSPTSLAQKSGTRVALSVCLVVIITATVFLFCFFSLFFGPIERGPLRVSGNVTGVDSDVSSALTVLRNYGIVAN